MQQEVPLADAREFSAAQLRRSLFLASGYDRLRVEPDSSVSCLHSSRFGKLVFGREAVEIFKVQAGVRIPQKPKDLKLRLSPLSVEFRSQEPLQVSQTLATFSGASEGYSRRVKVTNRAETSLRLRLLTIHDPTSLNFRRERDPPGEIGVNAFNRGDHVVMDDVGDTTGVRIIGFSPIPSAIYMTKDKQRAVDLIGSGELPDSTAGMSGAILVLTEQEFELQPGASTEFRIAALYHPSSLEVALSEFNSLLAGNERDQRRADPEPVIRSSSPSLNFACAWAGASMHSMEAEADGLERLSSGFGLRMLRPAYFEKQLDAFKQSQRKDGFMPHASSNGPGQLETALFLIQACGHLQLKADKKLSKKWYPALRKAGEALRGAAPKGLITTGPSSPDGWRRRLGSGYPTGELSETNIIASRSLSDLATLAYTIGKGTDSAGFKEASLKMIDAVNSTLKDAESGHLALNLDSKGRLHKEVTADQAVALSYNAFDHNLASSIIHRLLEKDFETGFGPRTIPNTNALYYNPSYGDGQLGGFWTRASLAHAMLAYASGYPSIAGLQLEKVSKLVYSECEAMGGVPGEFPYWLDPERKAIGSVGSDPVAASRFIEAVVVGELGLSFTPQGARLRPPDTSRLRWLLVRNLELGAPGCVFIGRTTAQPFKASSYVSVEVEGSKRYQGCERLETAAPLEGLLFWDQVSLLLCLGNQGTGDYAGAVSIPVRGKPISRSLYVDLEEFDQESAGWRRIERKKLLDRIELRIEVKSGSWKAFRVVQITS
jgi:hypothetical protein